MSVKLARKNEVLVVHHVILEVVCWFCGVRSGCGR